MLYGRVCGTVVSTLKHQALTGHKMLLVQPYDLQGRAHGDRILALDVVDAGESDWVLVLDEGSSASSVLGTPRGPVRTLVVGVVDQLDLPWAPTAAGPARQSSQRQGVDSPHHT
jgi:ethanolamine utilization protein EutN